MQSNACHLSSLHKVDKLPRNKVNSLQDLGTGVCTLNLASEPHSLVNSIADLRTGHWFNPRLGQYSFRGLMIVFATGFVPPSAMSVVSTMVILESSQWLGKNIVQSTGKKNSRKTWIGILTAMI